MHLTTIAGRDAGAMCGVGSGCGAPGAGDERKLNLIAQYEELKSKGTVDKVVEKQRRRQASKDHRFMPYARRT